MLIIILLFYKGEGSRHDRRNCRGIRIVVGTRQSLCSHLVNRSKMISWLVQCRMIQQSGFTRGIDQRLTGSPRSTCCAKLEQSTVDHSGQHTSISRLPFIIDIRTFFTFFCHAFYVVNVFLFCQLFNFIIIIFCPTQYVDLQDSIVTVVCGHSCRLETKAWPSQTIAAQNGGDRAASTESWRWQSDARRTDRHGGDSWQRQPRRRLAPGERCTDCQPRPDFYVNPSSSILDLPVLFVRCTVGYVLPTATVLPHRVQTMSITCRFSSRYTLKELCLITKLP